MKKFYKSDFDFILRLKDCKNQDIAVPFPECDWEIRFYTEAKNYFYIASFRKGIYTSCFPTEDGGIHFIFHNHRLGVGTLKWEPHFEHPNDIYPDNIQDLFSKEPLDIELVDGPGDCPTSAEVEIVAPFIKGDKGDKLTYSDLTEADKADLIAPIKDDIDKAMEEKADRTELSNVIGDITSFEDDGQFEAVTGFTRADLKLDLFIDLFNAAAGSNGRYDPEHAPDKEHVFLLNGLWLTYAEAVAVYVSWHKGVYQNEALAKFAVRTNMPFRTQWNSVLERYAQGNVTVEVLYLPMVLIGNQCMQAFYGCTNLRKVYGLSHLRTNIDSMTFQGCSKLEYVGITHLRGNLDLRWSPLLGADSIRFIVSNADNTSAVTITVHAEVYAKLTDPALAEWSGLIADAAAKNITFITA